ncbi:MAG: DUF721 domain-containing protein [Thiogranum sp.]|nr:DUF721 domain-containing protein [Thiogranum sp.]
MPRKDAVSCIKILEQAALPMLDRAQKLKLLEQTVLGLLPDNLAGHCKVVNLKNETLILATTSSAWAMRLRFAGPELLKQLRCQLPVKLKSLQVKVQPEAEETPLPLRPKPKLSMQNATLLVQTANTVDHPDLKEALYRLATKASDY